MPQPARARTRSLLLLLLSTLAAPAAAQQPAGAAAKSPSLPQSVTQAGVAVEFNVEPAAAGAPLKEGADASITFRITDAAKRPPVAGAKPAVWLSRRDAGAATSPDACREKVQTFLQGSLRARPAVDLNSYYILALNGEPNISVIDPLLGFGGSKLLTLVMLRAPGEDWALSADGRRLYVSMPTANQIAVVDTRTWKVLANVDTAANPVRVRLQPDGKYLWVGTDGAAATEPSGVAVIDTATLKVAAQITTGAGHHEIAFSPDSAQAFVTNQTGGTLSFVDAARLAKISDVKVVDAPVALDYSAASRKVYVAGRGAGMIVTVDPARRQVAGRVAAGGEPRSLRFAPGGRYGFVADARDSVVHVFDATTDRLLHSLPVGKGPDQIAFTKEYAYVRSSTEPDVKLVRLSTLGGKPEVMGFPGGQSAPEVSPSGSLLAPAPEGNAMLVANPADKMIYYYAEGMAAPMGNFQNYKRAPRAVLVSDRSLREAAPGVYRAELRLPAAGAYDVALLLDSPRVVHCFELSVAEDAAARKPATTALRVEYLTGKTESLRAGQTFRLRFKLTDAATGQPKAGLTDVRVLFFLAPGIWQKRDFARDAGGGVYELDLAPPQAGAYMVFVESQSQGVAFRQLPNLTLQVNAP